MSGLKKLFKKKQGRRQSASSAISTGSVNGSEPPGSFGLFGYRNVKEKDLPKLHKAAWAGDLNKLRQAIKKADINQQDKDRRTALHYATVKGHRDLVQWICTNRANVNTPDSEGRTPLMKAVECQRTDVVDVLLTHGAEANTNDTNLTTPMHLAAASGNNEIAGMLLDRNARVDPQDKEGTTPLHIAASLGDVEFVDFLVREFASLNLTDGQGRTALMGSAADGHIAVVKLLLDEGAEISVKDADGMTARDHAAAGGHNNVAMIFMDANNTVEKRKSKDANSNITPQRQAASPIGIDTNVFGGPAINFDGDSGKEDETYSRSMVDNSWADSDTDLDVSEKPIKKKPDLTAALKRITKTGGEEPKHGASSVNNALAVNPSPTSPNSSSEKQAGVKKIPNFFASSVLEQQKKEEVVETKAMDVAAPPKAAKVVGSMNADNSDSSGWESDEAADGMAVDALAGGPVSSIKGSTSHIKANAELAPAGHTKEAVPKKTADDFSFLSSSDEETDGDENRTDPLPLDGGVERDMTPRTQKQTEKEIDVLKDEVTVKKGNLGLDLVSAEQPNKVKDMPSETKEAEADVWDSSEEELESSAEFGRLATFEVKKPAITETTEEKNASLNPLSPKNSERNASVNLSGQYLDLGQDLDEPREERAEKAQSKEMEKVQEKEKENTNSDKKENARRKQFEDLGLNFSSLSSVSDPEGLSEIESERYPVSGLDVLNFDGGNDARAVKTTDSKARNAQTTETDPVAEVEPKQLKPLIAGTDNLDKAENAPADLKQREKSDSYNFDESDSSWDKSIEGNGTHSLGELVNERARGQNAIVPDLQGPSEDHFVTPELNDDLLFEEDNEQQNQNPNRFKEWEKEAKEQEERYAQEIKEELMREIMDNQSLESEVFSEEDLSLHTEDHLQDIEEYRVQGNKELESLTDDSSHPGPRNVDITNERKMSDKREQEKAVGLTEGPRVDEIHNDNSLRGRGMVGPNFRDNHEVIDEDSASEEKGSDLFLQHKGPSDDQKRNELSVGDQAERPPSISESLTRTKVEKHRDERLSEDVSSFDKGEGLDESVSFGYGSDEDLKIFEADMIARWNAEEIEGNNEKGMHKLLSGDRLSEVQLQASEAGLPLDIDALSDQLRNHENISPSLLPMKERGNDETIKKRLTAMIEYEKTREKNESPAASPRKRGGDITTKESKIPVFKERKRVELEPVEKLSLELRERQAEIDAFRKEEEELAVRKQMLLEEEGKLSEEVKRKKMEADLEETRKIEAERRLAEKEMRIREETRKLEELEKKREKQEREWSAKRKEQEEEHILWQEREKRRLEEDRRRLEEDRRKQEEERVRKERKMREEQELFERRLKELERNKLEEIERETNRLTLEVEERNRLREAESLRRLEEEEKEKRLRLQQEDRKLREALKREREELERDYKKREEDLLELMSTRENEVASRLAEIDKKKEEERLLKEDMIEKAVGSRRAALEVQLKETESKRRAEEAVLEEIMAKRSAEELRMKQLAARLEEEEAALKRKEEELNKRIIEDDQKRKERMKQIRKSKEQNPGEQSLGGIPLVEEDVIEASKVNVIEAGNLENVPSPAEVHLKRAKERGNELKSKLQLGKESPGANMRIQEGVKSPLRLPQSDLSDLDDEFSDLSGVGGNALRPERDSGLGKVLAEQLNGIDLDSESIDPDSPAGQMSPGKQDFKINTPNGVVRPSNSKFNRSLASEGSPVHRVVSASPKHRVSFGSPAPLLRKETSANGSLYSSYGFQDDDSTGRLQDTLRDMKRQLNRYKERDMAQESLKRELQEDVEQLQGTVEILSKSQTEAEQVKLDMDLELRGLKYKLEQEVEAKNVAENLSQQLKEQLIRVEEKLAAEFEAHQTIELAFRKQESDLRTRESLIHQLEEDLADIRLALDHEKESRAVQEELYQEQLRQHELVLQEAQRTSQDFALTVNQLEELDKSKKTAESDVITMKLEVTKLEGELARAVSQCQEIKKSYEEEVKRLKEKLEEKTNSLSSLERSSLQLQVQLDAERSATKMNSKKIDSELENEKTLRQRAESEVTLLKNQLERANSEQEHALKAKTNLEKELLAVKEQAQSMKTSLERECSLVKDQLEKTNFRLETTQQRLETLDHEAQRAMRDLAEKNGLIALAQRDVEHERKALEQAESKLQQEQESMHKLALQLEGARNRINSLERELEQMKREVDSSVITQGAKEKSMAEVQEKYNNCINSLKQDLEKERAVFEVKLSALQETNARLRSDLQEATERNKERDAAGRNVEQELNQVSKELTAIKVSHDLLSQAHKQMTEEKEKLAATSSDFKFKVCSLEEERRDLQGKVQELKGQLTAALSSSDDTKHKLASRDTDVSNILQLKDELEKKISTMQIDNTDLANALKEERSQVELLLDELRESNKARESLEALLTNIKSSNVNLEERLHSETLSRAQREREAEEHKGLWESEVRSRSKLGMRIIEMEKEIHRLRDHLQEEKRKTQEACARTNQLETQLDLYGDKSSQQQKEMAALRNKLKQYQKKLKDYESTESRVPLLHAKFDREREAMAANMSNLRRQVDQQNERLRQEQEQRTRAEIASKQCSQEISDLRTRDKILTYEKEKYEKQNRILEEELNRMRSFYESNYIDKNELDSYRQDIATKARLELNQKLQEVNKHLEDQAMVRETYDRIRNASDSKSKKDLEETILSLKNELSSVKATLQQGLAKQTTVESESKRFRELYEDELKVKERLSDRLAKANEKVAESTAQLNLERTRTQRLLDLKSSVGTISPSKLLSSPFMAGGISYTQPERDVPTSTPLRSGLDFKQFGGFDGDSPLTPLVRPSGLGLKDIGAVNRKGYFT